MFRPNFVILTVIMVIIILHGSLYPYDFHIPQNDSGPWQALAASWAEPPSGFGDLIANILLYMPFGLFGTLALRREALSRFAIVTCAGLVLCTSVELAQFYDQGRMTNLSDVYLNTFGTGLGVGAGSVLDGVWRVRLLRNISLHPVPVMLIAAMLGYHLFPYVPTIDLHKYWQSLKPVFLTPALTPLAVFHYFVLWLTTSYLVSAVMPNDAKAAPLFCAFVLFGKIVIVGLVLTVPELLGAALAVVCSLPFLKYRRGAAAVAAAALLALIMVLRLEPFKFHAAAAAFGWIPFKSLIRGSYAVNLQVFAEKFFLYGSCIWILCKAGLRLRYATLVVASLLLVTSYVEIYLPGRSAEVTDAVMAVLTAAIIAILERWNSGRRIAQSAAAVVPGTGLRRPQPGP
ncbi:MAG TPA: VanZ family protein [Stellaceae bacterium]|nr:VanZ family protein [Stellaceae bacterium]